MIAATIMKKATFKVAFFCCCAAWLKSAYPRAYINNFATYSPD